MSVKVCTKCEGELPGTTQYFYKHKECKLGLHSHCKECLGYAFKAGPPPRDGYKTCSKCGRELPATQEYFYGGSHSKLIAQCKECKGYPFRLRLKLVAQEGYKFCSKCQKELPATPEYFCRDKSHELGLYPSCKECGGHNFRLPSPVRPEAKPGYNVCIECERELPATLEYFHKAKLAKFGLRSSCKECLGYSFKFPPLMIEAKVGYRICTKCNRELLATLEYFNKDIRNTDGVGQPCRECCGANFRSIAKQGYRICTECKKELPATVDYFNKNAICKEDGLNASCKSCRNRLAKEKRGEYVQIPGNREKENRRVRESYARNAIEKRKKAKQRTANDPKYRLNRNISSSIGKALKGNKKGLHWEYLVDYTLDDLMTHLKKQFKTAPSHIRYGDMSWANYGKWHIHHRIPIAVFNFTRPEDIDFKRCWALKNLQPMWAKENMSKNDRLEQPFQPSLAMGI